VSNAFNALATEVARLPERDREDAVEALTAIGSTLMHDLSALRDTARILSSASIVSGSQAAQEARNLRRMFALWRRAREESVTADDLGVSGQQLKRLRDRRKLVALRLPMHREFVYPAWQFDSGTGQPLEGVSEVLAAAGEAKLSPLGLHLVMVSPAAEDGRAPAEWLASGQRASVVGFVTAANAHGS
jgi:hypothetical protein